jgi:hypothetical protein
MVFNVKHAFFVVGIFLLFSIKAEAIDLMGGNNNYPLGGIDLGRNVINIPPEEPQQPQLKIEQVEQVKRVPVAEQKKEEVDNKSKKTKEITAKPLPKETPAVAVKPEPEKPTIAKPEPKAEKIITAQPKKKVEEPVTIAEPQQDKIIVSKPIIAKKKEETKQPEQHYTMNKVVHENIHIEPQFVEGGGYTDVVISLKDMNRIVCPADDIGFVTYSKEKHIQVSRNGKNAFVKVLPMEVPEIDEKEYKIKRVLKRDASPRELYIECGGTVFSLIMTPKDVPAQTVILKNEIGDIKTAQAYETANDYEKTIFGLIKSAYEGVPVEGYQAKPFEFNKEFKEFSLKGVRKYLGAKYRVYEVKITAKEAIHLHEASFIKYFSKPVAITIVNPTLFPGDDTRLIVVSLQG